MRRLLCLAMPLLISFSCIAQADLRLPDSMVTQAGKPFREADTKGSPVALFFGFTNCPDVCPTTLLDMSSDLAALAEKADAIKIIFVTVDPERDTPDVMRDYVTAFSDRIVGISGPPDAVHAMVKDYKIYSRKVPVEGGDYSMDHTGSMILQDASGNFVGTIDSAESRDVGLAKLKRLVAG